MEFAKLPKKNNENFIEESVQELTFEQALDYCIRNERIPSIIRLIKSKFTDNPILLEKIVETMYEEIDEMQKREEFGYNYSGYR